MLFEHLFSVTQFTMDQKNGPDIAFVLENLIVSESEVMLKLVVMKHQNNVEDGTVHMRFKILFSIFIA